MLKTNYKNIAIGALQSKIHNLFHSLSRKCIQKMSGESLFWKSSPKNVSRKVEKSGDKNLLSRFFRLFRRRNSESKTLYRLVNQLDWLFILPPWTSSKKTDGTSFFLDEINWKSTSKISSSTHLGEKNSFCSHQNSVRLAELFAGWRQEMKSL